MKKIFVALAAMAVMSCVKDERDPQSLIPAPDPVYDYSGLVLNEVCGAGEDAEKFFELYNGGTEDVGLKDVYINKDEELSWTGVKGQVIKAGEVFAIIGAKGTTETGFSTGFSAKKTVLVELFAPDGTKLDAFQRGEKGSDWGASTSENTGSWSRIPNGKGEFVVTPTPTPGAVNDGTGATPATDLVDNKPVAAPAAVAKVVLNELDGNTKMIELYNAGTAPASLAGWKMFKDDKTEPNWVGPEGLTLSAGEYLALTSNETAPDYSVNFNSGFSAKKTVKIALFDANGNSIDTFSRGESPWGETLPNTAYAFARIPDGTGEFVLATVTPGASNGTESNGPIPLE